MERARQKEIGTLTVAVLATVGVVFFMRAATVTLDSLLGFSLGTLIAVLVWAAIIACAYVLLVNWQAGRIGVAIGGIVAMLLVGLFSVASIVGGLLLGLFMFSAGEFITRKSEDRISFRLRYIALSSMNLLIAGAAIAVFALSVPALEAATEGGAFGVSENFAGKMIAPAEAILASSIPGYTPTATVDELITAKAKQQAAAFGGVDTIPDSTIRDARSQLSSSLGITIQGNETVPDLVSQYFNTVFRRATAGNTLVTIIALAAAALIAIRTTVPLVAWVSLGFAHIIMFVLRKAGMYAVVEVPTNVQRVLM